MWRMNGLWSRTAAALLLCALLLSSGVMCQDDDAAADATDAPAADSADDASAATDAPAADATAAAADDVVAASSAAPGDDGSAPSAAPGDDSSAVTAVSVGADSGDSDDSADAGAPDAAVTAIAPAAGEEVAAAAPTEAPVVPVVVKLVVPDVTCVGEDDIPEGTFVKAEVSTDNCELTKSVIQGNPAGWCHKDDCQLKIFQDGNIMRLASEDGDMNTAAEALQSEHLKDKLGVTKVETPSSSGSSVFVGILVSGLLAAVGIIVGYFKCPRRTDAKGVRLAEEGYTANQDNQGNTLVSVAPLNPPPETPEKPSVNGESPEAAKTPSPPPTNGHSTAKTADTEL